MADSPRDKSTGLAKVFWWGAGAFALAFAAWLSSRAKISGDYDAPFCHLCDDPAPSLRALVHGDVAGFFHQQPIMGPVSLIVRLPAVGIVAAAHGSTLTEVRAETFPCIALAALGAVWIVHAAWRLGVRRPALAILAVLLAATIGWTNAIPAGHTEESLAAIVTAMALVCAFRRDALPAGLLLGLAIATKEWALLAAPPVLLMLDRDSARRAGIAALAVSVVLFGVMFAGDPSAFWEVHQERTSVERTVTAANIWWPFTTDRGDGVHTAPAVLDRYTRPGTFALALGLAALYAYRRRKGKASQDTLALFALFEVLRLIADTETRSYHHIPLLVAIPLWEVFSLRRIPVAGLIAAVAYQLTARELLKVHDPDIFNLGYLAWTLPLFAYLARATFTDRYVTNAAEAARR